MECLERDGVFREGEMRLSLQSVERRSVQGEKECSERDGVFREGWSVTRRMKKKQEQDDPFVCFEH